MAHVIESSELASQADAHTQPAAHADGQQHPIKLYLWIWLLLFVFSSFSYMVDYFQLKGYLRWSLILLFMFLKAGFIVSIFMHMKWERLALKLAILMPPLALLVLIGLMAIEGDYTLLTRLGSFVH
ncbi:MAG: cytochrome C oxidase subunit IV family protein [Povalibacter sp.]